MRNTKKILAAILAAAMMLSLCACGAKEVAEPEQGETTEPIVISISNAYTDLDQVNVELKKAAENIQERTNGAVVVNVYPNDTLGTITDGMEAIASNSPLMLVAGFGDWADIYPDGVALEAGFVYNNMEEVKRIRDTQFFEDVVAEMDKLNVHAFDCTFIGGMRHVIGREAYTTPEEIKGLKLRVPNTETFIEAFEALGACPMAMTASEQLTALSAGTVDALDQSISLIYSTKSYELVKEVSLIGQIPLSDGLFCSTTWWNSLPEEYQTIIAEELSACGSRYYDYSVENESTMRAELEAAGVTFHEVDRDAFAAMAGDLVLKYGIGEDLLAAVAEIRADMAAGN